MIKKIILVVCIIVFLLFILGYSNNCGYNQPNNFNYMMGNYFGNSMMSYGFGWFAWIFMMVWWILVIAGIVLLIKWFAGQSYANSDNKKTPQDILKERYAKGEIDKEEFEAKKKDLE
ncbi:MAG: hypothetical protein UR22_C0017G0015 [Parcubacteria group bacterium GW2011_GWC2_32_10]|nr:MAG: hypothetical protein UR22_C0017G0015 [Parcubacteria group bacterium GW2011_GWC2_32_10]